MSKLLLITVFCILGASSTKAGITLEDGVNIHMKVVEECMTVVGATASDLDDLINERPSSSMEGKCLHACTLKKFDVMDSDGKINREVVLEHSRIFTNNDADKMKLITEMLDACLSIAVPSDLCEAAEKYSICYKAEATARGIEKLEF